MFVTPSQSLSEIKQELLDMINGRGITDINGNSVPSDPEAIVFGVQVDKHDITKGWIPLMIPEVEEADLKKGKGVKKGSYFNESPQGAGLEDVSTVAFEFRDPSGGDNMDMDQTFDVIIPSYDDDGSQSQNPR